MGSISSKISYKKRQKQLIILKKRRENPEYIIKCKIANKAWYDRNKESIVGEADRLRDPVFLIETIKKIQQDINDRFNQQ